MVEEMIRGNLPPFTVPKPVLTKVTENGTYGGSLRTTIPPKVAKALGLAKHDYVEWKAVQDLEGVTSFKVTKAKGASLAAEAQAQENDPW